MSATSSSRISRQLLWAGFLFLFSSGVSVAAEGAAGLSATNKSDEVVTQEMRTYLQLQEQLHATQLAIESNRQASTTVTLRTAEALAERMQAIEQSLSVQRTRELEAMQSSNRTILIVAGCFAGLGFVAMLLMGYFQWRTVNRLAEISAAIPSPGLALGVGRALPALGPGDPPAPKAELLDAVSRLEKRIVELEHVSTPAVQSGTPDGNGEQSNGDAHELHAHAENGNTTTEANRLTLLLAKGQSLLNVDKPDEALACFDEVLTIDPHHADALVKKGTALERMRKLNEAIECYDRAIAEDRSMTIAYLYKGGLFNRMERFNEALQCYEQALRTQEKRS
jgi:tetratricopeptide (TPR) repeat protein